MRPNSYDKMYIILIVNFLAFVIVKFVSYRHNILTHYECTINNEKVVLNGKEFSKFKRKFEASNKMSPPCSLLSD